MNHLRSIILLVFSISTLCFNTTLSAAEDLMSDVNDDNKVAVQPRAEVDEGTIIKWHYDKDEVFKLAKEQDKFIFMFMGRAGCHNCQSTVNQLSRDAPLKIVENEYIMWYCNTPRGVKEVEEAKIYVDEMYTTMTPSEMPLFFIIDPNDSIKPLKYNYSVKSANYFATIFLPFDLPLKQGLRWYEDISVLFELAKTQKKLIFKFVGTGTSSNTKEVLKLLESNPLAKILSDNYILWYKRHNDLVVTTSSDVFTQDVPDTEDNEASDETETPEEVIKTAPYIYIIDPEKPNENIATIWGLQDVETIKELLEDPYVSNENIDFSDNKVMLNNNTLYISNSTDNETISVYSIVGQKIDVIQKNEPSISVNAASLPKGVLIIHSSKGWSAKVVKN